MVLTDLKLVGELAVGTAPALPYATISSVDYDPVNKLLYLSNSSDTGGVAVIDTKGTLSPSDDELVGKYVMESTGILKANRTTRVVVDTQNDLLYAFHPYDGTPTWASRTGISIIDRKGTKDLSDDARLGFYNQAGSPVLYTNTPRWMQFIPDKNRIVIGGTSAGSVTIFNTQGTRDPSDDTLAFRYDASATIPIASNGSTVGFMDPLTQILYMVSTGSSLPAQAGLQIVDTRGTDDKSDDVSLGKYDLTSTLKINPYMINDLRTYGSEGEFFLFTSGGIIKINHQNTSDLSDDVFFENTSAWSGATKVDYWNSQRNSFLMIVHGDKLGLFTPGKPCAQAKFTSLAVPSNAANFSELEWTTNSGSKGDAFIRVRGGDETSVWSREFSTNTSLTGIGDTLNLGWPGTPVIEAGVLKITQFGGKATVAFLIDSAVTEPFPVGSRIRMRYRINTAKNQCTSGVLLGNFNNRRNWFEKCNQWIDIDFTSEIPFSQVGLYSTTSTFDAADSVEVAYVQVEREGGSWGEWQSYSSSSGKTLREDLKAKSYYQFQVSLMPDPVSGKSPVLQELKWLGSYYNEGYLATGWFDISRSQWGRLIVDGDIPQDCSLRVSARKDSEEASLEFLETDGAHSFVIPEDVNATRVQFGLNLACANQRVTPVIRGLRLVNE